MDVTIMVVKPKILKSYETFSKYLVNLGFHKPTKKEYKKACEQWQKAENEKFGQKTLNGVLKREL
jgi:hypothetical protein